MSRAAVFRNLDTWIIGDSITVGSYQDLQERMIGAGRSLATDASSGIDTQTAVDRLYQHVVDYGSPRVLVVALGSNDVWGDDANNKRVAAQFSRIRAMVGPTTRIVYVNIFTKWQNISPEDSQRTFANCTKIADAIAATGTVNKVVDWYGIVKDDPGRYLTDGVHLTDEGRTTRNQAILKVLT